MGTITSKREADISEEISVLGPDGKIHYFPPGTDDAAIDRHMSAQYPEKKGILGGLKSFWQGISQPSFNTEGLVRKHILPEEEMSPTRESLAGIGLGTARSLDALSSPTAVTTLLGGSLLGGQGILSDIALLGFSGDMLRNASKNLGKVRKGNYEGQLPREKAADYSSLGIEGLMAVAPWLFPGRKSVLKNTGKAVFNRSAPPYKPAAPAPAGRPEPIKIDVSGVPRPRPRPESAPAPEIFAGQGGEVLKNRIPFESPGYQFRRDVWSEGKMPESGLDYGKEMFTPGSTVYPRRPQPKSNYIPYEGPQRPPALPPEPEPLGSLQGVGGNGPEESLYTAIKKLGGISRDRLERAGVLSEWKEGVPRWQELVTNKGQWGDDTIVNAVNGRTGLNLETADELRAMLAGRNTSRRGGHISQAELSRMESDYFDWLQSQEQMSRETPEFFDYEGAGIREPGEEGFAAWIGDEGAGRKGNKGKFAKFDDKRKMDPKLDAFFRSIETHDRAKDIYINELISKTKNADAVELVKMDPASGKDKKIIIHRSTNEPGRWQASSFDEKGPWGHQVYDSLDSALMDYSGGNKSIASMGTVGEWRISRIKRRGEEGFARIRDDSRQGNLLDTILGSIAASKEARASNASAASKRPAPEVIDAPLKTDKETMDMFIGSKSPKEIMEMPEYKDMKLQASRDKELLGFQPGFSKEASKRAAVKTNMSTVPLDALYAEMIAAANASRKARAAEVIQNVLSAPEGRVSKKDLIGIKSQPPKKKSSGVTADSLFREDKPKRLF
jgi:hypothetical protein